MNTSWKIGGDRPARLGRRLAQGTDRHVIFDSDVSGEQRRLRDYVVELREWLYEVEQLGIPKFGETGYKLRDFRKSLATHFESCRASCKFSDGSEIDRQAQLMLARLDELIQRLEMTDPPFGSWQELTRSMGQFTDDLEAFEDQYVNEQGC